MGIERHRARRSALDLTLYWEPPSNGERSTAAYTRSSIRYISYTSLGQLARGAGARDDTRRGLSADIQYGRDASSVRAAR